MLFVLAPLTAGNAQQEAGNILSPQNRLLFGNSLYIEKDYLRAANEFKEYLKYEFNDTVQFRFANSFFKIGRYQESADNFKTLFFGSRLSEEARLMFYESIFFQNDFKSFRELADRENYHSEKYNLEIERLKSTTYFFDKNIFPNENVLLKPFPDSSQSQLAKFYYQKKNPQYKSPTTAALLSIILPGAGKIYTGEITDGIVALLSTTISAYLAYSSFHNDHQFRGWLFSGLAAFFYGGNIYGSAASAQIYNVRLNINLDKEIKLYFEQRNYFLPKID